MPLYAHIMQNNGAVYTVSLAESVTVAEGLGTVYRALPSISESLGISEGIGHYVCARPTLVETIALIEGIGVVDVGIPGGSTTAQVLFYSGVPPRYYVEVAPLANHVVVRDGTGTVDVITSGSSASVSSSGTRVTGNGVALLATVSLIASTVSITPAGTRVEIWRAS